MWIVNDRDGIDLLAYRQAGRSLGQLLGRAGAFRVVDDCWFRKGLLSSFLSVMILRQDDLESSGSRLDYVWVGHGSRRPPAIARL
jgi:hypothetical protein